MNAYVYRAALLCEDCAIATMKELDAAFQDNGIMPGDPLNDDSDRYPQGPYANGGGESDSPCHCDHCQTFLENPLTDDGREYVNDAIENNPSPITKIWADYYLT